MSSATTSFNDDGTPVITFTGSLVDQAACMACWPRIRDMNLPLISVNQIKLSSKDGS